MIQDEVTFMSTFTRSMDTEQRTLLYGHSDGLDRKASLEGLTETTAWVGRRGSFLSNPTRCIAVHLLFTLGNILILGLCVWIYLPRSSLDSPVGSCKRKP